MPSLSSKTVRHLSIIMTFTNVFSNYIAIIQIIQLMLKLMIVKINDLVSKTKFNNSETSDTP